MRQKVSIILTSYNKSKYIRRALQSCLSQTYQNLEIIIGDDGSNDGSISVIKDFCKSENAQYFVMNRDEDEKDIIPSIRVSNIIKKALNMVTGEYVVLLSADDLFIDQKKIEKAVSFLSTHDEYCAYITGFKYVGSGYNKESYPNVPIKNLFWASDYLHISCFLFRWEKQYCQYLPDRMCDDTGFIFSLLFAGKWKFDHSLSFGYFQDPNGIMHTTDTYELNILELLLLQDILNKTAEYKHPSNSRYFLSYLKVFIGRNNLQKLKYKKYINSSKKYNNNILYAIYNFDESSIREKAYIIKKIISMGLDFVFYKFCRKIFRIYFYFRKENIV